MYRLRQDLIRIGRLLGARGLIFADDGNLSARADDGTILVTESGTRKDDLTPGDFVRLDPARGPIGYGGAPSSEWGLHLAIYRQRPDVGAIVHLHPPAATGFAAAGVPIPDDGLAEAHVRLGPVPVVPYAKPGTRAIEEAVLPYAVHSQALLLANHGVLAFGRDPDDACRRMERLELVARTLLVARLIGGERTLTRAQLEELRDATHGG